MRQPLSALARVALLGCALLSFHGCSLSNSVAVETKPRQEPGTASTRDLPAVESDRSTTETLPAMPTGSLSLEAAIDKALNNNQGLRRTVWKIEQAKAMLDLAEAAFWPQVSFYTEYLQGDAPSSYLFKKIDQRQLPPGVNFNEPGWFENYESGIQARLNLYRGGTDRLAREMAGNEIAISQWERSRVENNLTAQVITAYYDTVAAEDFIAIAEDSVTTVEEQLRILQVHFEGGAAVKSDVLSMEVRLAQARERLVSSRNRLQLARAALGTLLGFDPERFSSHPLRLEPGELGFDDFEQGYEKGIIKALNRRAELAQIRYRLNNSRLALDSAKRAFLPHLDLMARYYLDDPDLDYDSQRENWTAALLLNWDLFTGFSRTAEISRSEAVVEEMQAADRQAVLDIKLDVKRAYLNLEEAVSRYQVAKSSVDSAEESFRLVREHYRGGAVTVTRYLEAELDRSRARISATAARYDTIKARAEVARALGVWGTNIRDQGSTLR